MIAKINCINSEGLEIPEGSSGTNWDSHTQNWLNYCMYNAITVVYMKNIRISYMYITLLVEGDMEYINNNS